MVQNTTVSEKAFRIIDLIHSMISAARAFVKQKDFIPGDSLNQKEIDAVIVDFINYTASLKCIELALHTCDLRVAEKSKYFDYRNLKETDKQVAISLPKGSLKLYFPIALDLIIRNSHMNKLKGVTTLSQADVEKILQSFMTFFEKERW